MIELVTEQRAQLQQRRRQSAYAQWFDVLDQVKDPELPALSIWDLGILQNVELLDEVLEVTITPTFSGCPAMEAIEADILHVLRANGAERVAVKTQLAPPWSSDWMDRVARQRLQRAGVAPPHDLACPQCGSRRTELISEFGSTACKSLHRCLDCEEPFDQFKPF